MDWAAWSRDSVSQLSARARDLLARHSLAESAPYRWDLETAALKLGNASFGLVTVGTITGGSFLWSWANDSIPPAAKVGIDKVRQFGIDNDLELLIESCAPGGLPQGQECLAIAARILDADGSWIDATDAGYILFALRDRGLDLR
ncbi:MAG: hypothetical protein HOV81_45935 [Kofleriaceae bacterium]|nr:hypothetical protein [Kofleriaceae bacterium]